MQSLNQFLDKLRRIRNNLEIHWLASRYQIGKQYRRVYHYHIRKSAGTSLNSTFCNLAGLDLYQFGRRSRIWQNGFVFVRHQRKLIEEGKYFYANSHLPAYELNLPPNTFTITILRDPVKRLLSYYKYLTWIRNDPNAHKNEPYFKELQQETEVLGDSFQDFLDQILPKHLSSQLYMFSKNYDCEEALERILQCSMICFTETFSQDIKRLADELALPLQEKNERRMKQKITIPSEAITLAQEKLEKECILIDKVKQAVN